MVLRPAKEKGFTIVELMIALSVLSVVLLLGTVVLIRIGAIYSKGVNEADLQGATRTIMTDVTSSLQFSGNDPTPSCVGGTSCVSPSTSRSVSFGGTPVTVHAVCIGTTRYSYVLNYELGNDSYTGPDHNQSVDTPHVLWRDTMTGAACTPLDLTLDNPDNTHDGNSSGNGYEMAPNHTRLTRFNVTTSASDPGLFNIDVWMAYGDSDLLDLSNSPPTCNGGTGQQFCAVSTLSTSVARRLN
jgi:prepilin-type N-terminal cleavage/methylation domain-containing protein